MSFHDHFSKRAALYAAARPTYPAELTDFLARLCRRTDYAWEAGCGSGQLTRDVARKFTRVIATDASYQQLTHANSIANVTFHCATAENSGVRSGQADFCVAAQAAHWFDLSKYYDEVRRVSRPNAIIALIAYGVTHLPGELDPILQTFHTTVLPRYWPPERSHVDANYETLPFPFERITTPAFEMSVDWTYDELAAYVNTWSGVQALVKDEGEEPLSRFLNELKDAWGAAQQPKRVTWPVGLLVGRVD